MNINAMRAAAEKEIELSKDSKRLAEARKKNDGFVFVDVSAAKRTLELCDIIEGLTADEAALLKSIPAYETNYSAAKPIKDKYNLSWSEVKRIRAALY